MQATEEAVVSALVAADTTVGIDGHVSPGLPNEQVAALFAGPNDGARITSAACHLRPRVRPGRARPRAACAPFACGCGSSTGIPGAEPHGDPLAELVLTVLSQSTNDRNRDVAYFRLRDRFATWDEVRDAPVDAVEEAIRPGGISKVKSARIRDILAAISPDGAVRLPDLASMTVPRAQAYLTSLPGVGRKTAACVLLFALGMRDVPVDTHVSRVGIRLGLFRPGARFEEMHDRCSRSPRAARSSSSISTSCATAAGPATPAGPPAATARCSACAPRSASSSRGGARKPHVRRAAGVTPTVMPTETAVDASAAVEPSRR